MFANKGNNKICIVTVKYVDGCKERYRASEVSFNSTLIKICFEDGNNRVIQLNKVKHFTIRNGFLLRVVKCPRTNKLNAYYIKG